MVSNRLLDLTQVDKAVFSSETACEAVARRLIRRIGEGNQNVVQTVFDTMSPWVNELGSRKKIARSRVRPLVMRLLDKMRSTLTVLSLAHDHFTPGMLHSDDVHRIRMVFLFLEGEAMLRVAALEALATRKNFLMSIRDLNVAVMAHALVRFMMRERKPPADFLQGMLPALGAAFPIAVEAHRHRSNPSTANGDRHLAAALGSGLLLGKVTALEPERDILFKSSITSDDIRNGFVTGSQRGRASNMPAVEMIIQTYVDEKNLTPQREALRDLLVAHANSHQEGIARLQNDNLFPMPLDMPSYERELETDLLVKRTMAAASDIVSSPEWTYFCQTVREDVAPRPSLSSLFANHHGGAGVPV